MTNKKTKNVKLWLFVIALTFIGFAAYAYSLYVERYYQLPLDPWR